MASMVTPHSHFVETICAAARMAPWCARGILAAMIGLSLCAPVSALIVGNAPSIVPATTINPQDYVGWTQGDPGWNNVVANGSNYVYLGDGWVLSARHVGYNATNGVQLQTMLPDGSLGPVQTFYRIPGDYYYDYGYSQSNTRYYAVSNPTTTQSQSGQTISLQDSRGTYFTDLQLFRINGDPGLPALTIASQPMPSDFTRATAPEVVMIGRGRGRQAPETHWDVTVVSDDQWTWTATTGPGDYQGYRHDSVSVKRWGTNRLTDLIPNQPGDPSDPGATNYTQDPNDLFDVDDVVSDTRVVLPITTGDGATRDLVSLMTVYDRQSSPGATALEFQARGGNSGSGVFYRRGDQWELAGIAHAIFSYTDQSGNISVYGNTTMVSDLSFYNQDYFNSIKHIMESHPDYSHVGDVNLDGSVSGDGSGPPGTDDVTDFVLGWGYNNGMATGTITSWKNGDLNHDGRTNVADFIMLRGSLNGAIPDTVVAALFGDGSFEPGSGGVPEPNAGLLAIMASAWLTLTWRRRTPIL
jgi:hypothetical protein